MSAEPITDFDLYLFGEGKHERIYEKLGAHPQTERGPRGTRFAVWAPNAERVGVVGPFNDWDGTRQAMHCRGDSGVWELFVPDLPPGTPYKYEIGTRAGGLIVKADPYGFAMQLRPGNCSVVAELEGYGWRDGEWLARRADGDPRRRPLNIYEVHLASWRRPWDLRTPPFMGWREAAEQLIPYAQDLGFTHLELMGVAEHPLDASWGYQVTGYYAATARYGSAQDFMYFVDCCHQAGVGVILDWVPAHFPRDDCGLTCFDGTALYEHADARLGEHAEWGTKVFNFGRHEVRNFLVANALFWMDRYHVDGLRVDAVASMLYLDYNRKPGEWLPNRYGGRENIEAIDFLRQMNDAVHRAFPGSLTIAEESTAFPQVTQPPAAGGLGFNFKWNMGWMNDTLKYFALDPIHRRHNHQLITFSFVYAWSENFILPISHDEAVHGKGSLLGKMPGDEWQKRANCRLLIAYMTAHPGKKLLFMGAEFAQWREWRDHDQLDWYLTQDPGHQGLRDCVRELNRLYLASAQLHFSDADGDGFRWLDLHNADESVFAFQRRATAAADAAPLICVFNATPVPRDGYAIGLPEHGQYLKVLDTDSVRFGGSGYNRQDAAPTSARGAQGYPYSLRLNLPPLAALFFSGPR
ncbi:MAG TPA: 1,4-alpha-glucan branching protein GlgB [Steroidobacteraceae bacterium]|nr:1,4-alpha-glucan branching protein GlgB [Steroidobacteraceae bacterium]